jgi:hypothetical protein
VLETDDKTQTFRFGFNSTSHQSETDRDIARTNTEIAVAELSDVVTYRQSGSVEIAETESALKGESDSPADSSELTVRLERLATMFEPGRIMVGQRAR